MKAGKLEYLCHKKNFKLFSEEMFQKFNKNSQKKKSQRQIPLKSHNTVRQLITVHFHTHTHTKKSLKSIPWDASPVILSSFGYSGSTFRQMVAAGITGGQSEAKLNLESKTDRGALVCKCSFHFSCVDADFEKLQLKIGFQYSCHSWDQPRDMGESTVSWQDGTGGRGQEQAGAGMSYVIFTLEGRVLYNHALKEVYF